jgi:hypothetical protein
MATNTPALLARYAPVQGTAPTRFNISNKAITTNLATITTSAAHGITQVGTIVTIQGVDSTHDGTWAINSIPSGTTFTYVSTTATQSSTAVSPVGTATFNSAVVAGQTVTNKVVQNYVATLTTTAAHGFSVGDMVYVTLGDTIYDGTQVQIIAVPSTTTFSYIVTTQTSATTAITQGAVGKYPAGYTVPASTTTIATNILVANKSSASQTYTICLDTVCIAYQQSIAANGTVAIDLKQTLTTGKVIMGSASSPLVNLHISGMTVA